MNREETYYESVDILLDAYNNRTLRHGDCGACAVGNLLGTRDWFLQIGSYSGFEGQRIIWQPCAIVPEVENSPYTPVELVKIEEAFEKSIEDDYTYYAITDTVKGQYVGLCAVLKVLGEIHEIEEKKSQERLEEICTRLSSESTSGSLVTTK